MSDQWFPWFHGDYLRDTKSLSLTEHGVYLMLIGEQFTTEQPLPQDWAALHRIAGAHTDAEKHAVESVVEKFFTADGRGGLVQGRVMAEVQKRQRVKDRNTRIARERYQNGTSELPLDAPNGDQKGTSTSTSTSTSTPTRERSRACALPPDFGLTPEREEYARSKGVAEPKREMEAFRAHHLAHGKTMKDWDAAWRTWCLNAIKFGGKRQVTKAGMHEDAGTKQKRETLWIAQQEQKRFKLAPQRNGESDEQFISRVNREAA